jgi:hypothetical protein
MNLYAYVGNDPINSRDSSGLVKQDEGDILVCSSGVTVYFPNSARRPICVSDLDPNIDRIDYVRRELDLYQAERGRNEYNTPPKSKNPPPWPEKGRQGREVPCSSLDAFNDAVSDNSFADTLAKAAAGDATTQTEHSFVYGPLLNFGPDIFSNHPPSRFGNFTNTSETFWVPIPRISFHTHRNASRTLSNEDLTSAVNNRYPTAIYDLNRKEFRCVVGK